MAKRNSSSPQPHSQIPAAQFETLQQTIADVEGLEKLQLMQLTMIRAIRRELKELEKSSSQATSG